MCDRVQTYYTWVNQSLLWLLSAVCLTYKYLRHIFFNRLRIEPVNYNGLWWTPPTMWNPLTSFPWISINLTQSTMKLTMLICWTVLLTTFWLRFGERFSTNNGYSNCYLLCPPCSWPVFIFVWGATEIQYFNCEFPFRMYQNPNGPSILSISIKTDIQYKVCGFSYLSHRSMTKGLFFLL